MKVKELIEKIDFEVIASSKAVQRDISGVYIGDLLSDVMGCGDEGNLWITVQSHLNVVAVALLKEFSAIVVIGESEIAEEVIQKANDEDLAILRYKGNSYQLAKLLVGLGL